MDHNLSSDQSILRQKKRLYLGRQIILNYSLHERYYGLQNFRTVDFTQNDTS